MELGQGKFCWVPWANDIHFLGKVLVGTKTPPSVQHIGEGQLVRTMVMIQGVD